MGQTAVESGPDAISGFAERRGEVLKPQTSTTARAARIIKPGIQISLWPGCMAFSFGDCASDASCASLHSENGQRVIPCRISEGDAPDPSATAILTDGYGDFAQLSRKLEMFAVFELFFALLAVFFFGAFPFQELFFGHLVIVAGGEHGTALAALRGTETAALSVGGGEIAHAANRVGQGACFY